MLSLAVADNPIIGSDMRPPPPLRLNPSPNRHSAHAYTPDDGNTCKNSPRSRASIPLTRVPIPASHRKTGPDCSSSPAHGASEHSSNPKSEPCVTKDVPPVPSFIGGVTVTHPVTSTFPERSAFFFLVCRFVESVLLRRHRVGGIPPRMRAFRSVNQGVERLLHVRGGRRETPSRMGRGQTPVIRHGGIPTGRMPGQPGGITERGRAVVRVGIPVHRLRVRQIHQRVHRDEPAQIRVISTLTQLGQPGGFIDGSVHETPLTRPHTLDAPVLAEHAHPPLDHLTAMGIHRDLPGAKPAPAQKTNRENTNTIRYPENNPPSNHQNNQPRSSVRSTAGPVGAG